MFESQLKGQEYDLSFDSVRWLFVVLDFAWKTKKQTRTKNSFPFLMVETIKTHYLIWSLECSTRRTAYHFCEIAYGEISKF